MSDTTDSVVNTPKSIAEKKNYITVTKGIAYFAVEFRWNPGGFWEPYIIGGLRYSTKTEAEVEAKQWAEEDGLEYIPNEGLA